MGASALGLVLGLILRAPALRALRNVVYGRDADARCSNAFRNSNTCVASCKNRPGQDAARRIESSDIDEITIFQLRRLGPPAGGVR